MSFVYISISVAEVTFNCMKMSPGASRCSVAYIYRYSQVLASAL